MAVQHGKFISGTLDGLIYYVVNGKQRIRTKGTRINRKQSEAVKRSCGVFGQASSLCTAVRQTFQVNRGTKYDNTVHERLTGTIRKILGSCNDIDTGLYNFEENSFSKLAGFDFNAFADLQKYLPKEPVLKLNDQSIQVHIPEFRVKGRLKFPPQGFGCKLSVSFSCFDLKGGTYLPDAEKKSISFDAYTEMITDQIFEFNAPPGCLCIAAVQLEFTEPVSESPKITDKNYNPFRICGALITPEIFGNDVRFKEKMSKFEQLNLG